MGNFNFGEEICLDVSTIRMVAKEKVGEKLIMAFL